MVQKANAERKSGILVRLAKNEEGNVIALLAAAVIPAIGLMGGAVDLSRMYLTQTRLQAACDAGVLMGRKTMGVGSWSSANNYPNTMALQMFDQNFARGAYGSRDLERGFAEIDGNVAGSASATIPMALMQVLNVPQKQISVTCKAAMNTPDSDVMFVLDVTGSMIDGMSGDASGVGSKLDNLKIAVKCFYEALAKQNIEGVRPDQCGEATNPPANSTIGNVQLRFGFVPYAQNVNVGRLLPKDYMADQWSYQSRVPTYDLGTSNFTGWTYKQVSFDISKLKQGTGAEYAQTVSLPLGINENTPGDRDITWSGCVEERKTFRTIDGTPQDDWDPIPASAYDMDIDKVPDTDPATKWGPVLRGAVWQRFELNGAVRNPNTRITRELFYRDPGRPIPYDDQMPRAGDACPQPAKKMQSWNPSDLNTYVDGLTAGGYTYHDIGLIWGARLMSPEGMFASEINNLGNRPIQRHMVFMTDGATDLQVFDYSAYGVAWYDRRQTKDGEEPTRDMILKIVNARTTALCKAIKNKNITLWVVRYGNSSFEQGDIDRLRNCASPGKYVEASNTVSLTAKFKNIASEITALRLTE